MMGMGMEAWEKVRNRSGGKSCGEGRSGEGKVGDKLGSMRKVKYRRRCRGKKGEV